MVKRLRKSVYQEPPNATKKLPELTEKVWGGGLVGTFCLVTRGRSPRYFLQCIIYLHLHRGLEAVNPPLVYSQSYGTNVHQSSRPYVVVSGNKVVVHFWFQLHTGWDSPSSNIQAKLEYSMPT